MRNLFTLTHQHFFNTKNPWNASLNSRKEFKISWNWVFFYWNCSKNRKKIERNTILFALHYPMTDRWLPQCRRRPGMKKDSTELNKISVSITLKNYNEFDLISPWNETLFSYLIVCYLCLFDVAVWFKAWKKKKFFMLSPFRHLKKRRR